jgi:hypothetical protein
MTAMSMKELPHGTRTRYLAMKCRCVLCKKANSDYGRQYRQGYPAKRLEFERQQKTHGESK